MGTDTVSDDLQQYYARRAPHYDASMGYDGPVSELLQEVIDCLAQGVADRRVLEVACGPGFWTAQLAGRARHITATDINTEALEQARAKSIDAARVTFSKADAYDLPTLTPLPEAALLVDWFSHVPWSRQRDFLKGLHGKLAPGARVLVCDQLPGPKSMTGEYDAEGNHLQLRTLPDGSRYTIVKHFFTDAEALDAFGPFAAELAIHLFPDAGRYVVDYRLPS